MKHNFMTVDQVRDYLQETAAKKGVKLHPIDIRDIDEMFFSRPWFMEYELVDGKMTVVILSDKEFRELDNEQS